MLRRLRYALGGFVCRLTGHRLVWRRLQREYACKRCGWCGGGDA